MSKKGKIMLTVGVVVAVILVAAAVTAVSMTSLGDKTTGNVAVKAQCANAVNSLVTLSALQGGNIELILGIMGEGFRSDGSEVTLTKNKLRCYMSDLNAVMEIRIHPLFRRVRCTVYTEDKTVYETVIGKY